MRWTSFFFISSLSLPSFDDIRHGRFMLKTYGNRVLLWIMIQTQWSKWGRLTQNFFFLNEVWTYCTCAGHGGEQCCVNVSWLAGGPAHSGVDSQWAAPPSNQPFTSALQGTVQLLCTVGRQHMTANNEVNKTMLSGNSPEFVHGRNRTKLHATQPCILPCYLLMVPRWGGSRAPARNDQNLSAARIGPNDMPHGHVYCHVIRWWCPGEEIVGRPRKMTGIIYCCVIPWCCHGDKIVGRLRGMTEISPWPESDQTTCRAAIYVAVLFVDGAPVVR